MPFLVRTPIEILTSRDSLRVRNCNYIMPGALVLPATKITVATQRQGQKICEKLYNHSKAN